MNARKKRLGRGLDALLSKPASTEPAPKAAEPPASKDALKTVPVDLLQRGQYQPRVDMRQDSLDELAQSIRAQGVVQPIVVRPVGTTGGPGQRYEIVAGERRWRAARLAGLETIPAVVRNVDELELLEVGIIENVQRADLNPIEEAEAYEALMNRFGRTQESLASSVGKSRVHITNTLRLLQLPEAARAYVREGKVTAGHARAALGASDPEAVIEMAAARGLSVREVEALVKGARDGGSPETKTAKARAPEKDVDTEALEADLMRQLGLQVDIRHGNNGGELRIKYRDLEQLDDVCRRLTRKKA